jgi:TrmH family RNA methyltransferase
MNRLDVETQVFGVTDPVFKKMAYLRQPEGVLAVVEQPAWSLDRLPTVSSESLFLVAVGTQKPGNLGAMVRTAAAAGCTAVLAAGPIVDAFNPNAICSSTGAVYDLPTVSGSEQLVRDYLQNHGVRMLAACLDGPTPHRDADWTGPVAVVIGPEDRGLSESWLEAAKASGGGGVSIRMQSGVVDSLNAGVAAAVLLFEARR